MGYSLVTAHRLDRTGGDVGLIHKDVFRVKKMDA